MKGAAGVAMQIMVGRADAAPSFALRHFIVEPGGHTPHHSHPYEHEVYVVAGSLAAECDGSVKEVSGGDVLLVPSGAVHQFVNQSSSPARFLCVVPLESDCGEDVPGS
jgi:quercetin dioxygenase-like cupin family protein